MTTEGWVDDYLDPADTLNNFLDGSTIGPANNLDISYFDDPRAVNARRSGSGGVDGAGALFDLR